MNLNINTYYLSIFYTDVLTQKVDFSTHFTCESPQINFSHQKFLIQKITINNVQDMGPQETTKDAMPTTHEYHFLSNRLNQHSLVHVSLNGKLATTYTL